MPLATIPQQIIPLDDPGARSALRQLVSNLAFFDEVAEAYKTYRYLQWVLKQSSGTVLSPDAAAEYNEMLRLLQFVALPALPEAEIEDFFKTKVTLGLSYPDLDLWDKVVGKLVRIFVFEERDPFKARLRAALEANGEMLTAGVIQEGDKKMTGTAGNWLRDYRKAAGGRKVSTLVRTAYLTNSANTKNLSAEERGKVQKLIELYERLKISSMESEGIEENYLFEDAQGRILTLRGGKLEEAKDKNAEEVIKRLYDKGLFSNLDLTVAQRWERAKGAQQETLAEVKRLYAQTLDPAVTRILEQLRKDSATPVRLAELCYNAAFPSPEKKADRAGALAALALLAERGQLPQLLKSGSALRNALETSLRAQGKETVIEGMKMRPDAPEYLVRLLRLILEEKLGMSTSDAARFGAYLGNLLKTSGKPQYFDMVYFDAVSKMFVWK